MRERAGFSHCLAVTVDTSGRTSAAASAGKSEVMEKTNQERRRPRKLPWLTKQIALKDDDHRGPTLRWSSLIFIMELRKNGLEVGESIFTEFI